MAFLMGFHLLTILLFFIIINNKKIALAQNDRLPSTIPTNYVKPNKSTIGLLPMMMMTTNRIAFNPDQRPLYNIAHMCNSIEKTVTNLARGANAIEVDITFKNNGVYLYHGYPCDCFRYCWDFEELGEYLTFARKTTTLGSVSYNPRFVILYFDVKLNGFDSNEKFQKGSMFATYLAKYFFTKNSGISTLRLVVGISYSSDVNFLVGFIQQLQKMKLFNAIKNRIGFDTGMETNKEEVRAIWNRLNVTNVWQGEGITNCLNPILPHQIEKLVAERERPVSRVSKVYRWTIDLSDAIKTLLSYDVDGMMTNHPERVVKILHHDPEISKLYRIATIFDDPWKRFPKVPHAWRNQVTNKSNNDKVRSLLQDLKDSLFRYMHEVFRSVF